MKNIKYKSFIKINYLENCCEIPYIRGGEPTASVPKLAS